MLVKPLWFLSQNPKRSADGALERWPAELKCCRGGLRRRGICVPVSIVGLGQENPVLPTLGVCWLERDLAPPEEEAQEPGSEGLTHKSAPVPPSLHSAQDLVTAGRQAKLWSCSYARKWGGRLAEGAPRDKVLARVGIARTLQPGWLTSNRSFSLSFGGWRPKIRGPHGCVWERGRFGVADANFSCTLTGPRAARKPAPPPIPGRAGIPPGGLLPGDHTEC